MTTVLLPIATLSKNSHCWRKQCTIEDLSCNSIPGQNLDSLAPEGHSNFQGFRYCSFEGLGCFQNFRCPCLEKEVDGVFHSVAPQYDPTRYKIINKPHSYICIISNCILKFAIDSNNFNRSICILIIGQLVQTSNTQCWYILFFSINKQ